MKKLEQYAKLAGGTPQFRITEAADRRAPVYCLFGQNDLMDDLTGMDRNCGDQKKIRTYDNVSVLFTGDIVFSLISGTACMVSKRHEGYLYTQNYIRLFISGSLEPAFLVYLLNENQVIKRQFETGLQGTSILKYTIKQLKNLELPALPSLQRQKQIGELYLKQLNVEALKKRAAEAEKLILFRRLEALCDEGSRV